MEQKESKKGMARLMELAFTKKGLTFAASALSLISTAVSFVPYAAIYFIVKELLLNINDLSGMDASYVVGLGWLAGGSAMGCVVLNYAALMCSHVAAFETIYALKLDFARHLAALPMGFHTQNSTGKLRKTSDKNIEELEGFIAHQLPDIVGSFAAPVIALAMLFVFDWRFGLASLVPIILAYGVQAAAVGGGKSAYFIKKYQTSLEEMNNAAVEYVRGVSVVKAFNGTIFSFRRFYSTIKAYGEFVTGYTKTFRVPYALFVTVINSVYLFIVPAAVLLSGSAENYPDFALTVIFYIIFSLSLTMPFMKILYVSQKGGQIADGVERMDKIFAVQPLPIAKNPKTADGFTVEFDDVSFSYGDGKENLTISNASFTAEQGRITALVGPSGGGKSTLASLIPRFYDPSGGNVKIGGADIRDMSEEYLMSIVSFVFQDVFLFKQTVAENIAAGNKNASREDIIKAARAAQAHEFIEKLPNGYDTVIGKDNRLSGGEKQRVAIARAILKNAPIIVLDEATAFADPENEQKIQTALNELMKDKTVIIIAHRLSTVVNADKIVVIADGRVSERGKHGELLKNGGAYKNLWEKYNGGADPIKTENGGNE
ncbi:MAG: ABC transporter ATP-binding protein/permease [Clostridiales bacterium]|jgi:ATP-binding cassette subfamily B protein|nr:ABC transporter ATP-binding protein/permease [Clostridiales bacterium]